MAGSFEIKQAANGKYHFNLKAGNGEIILSSQMYEDKSGAENGIDSVKRNAAEDEMFDRLTSESGDPYFVLKAKNAQVIGRSEMYSSTSARDNGIESVKRNAIDASINDKTLPSA
jgi:hypothetical protein